MNYFNTIYRENLWKNDESISGDGSTLKCSYPYLSFLNEFVTDNNIKKIIDLGCGDFNLMKHFDFKNVEYLGIDLVNELIEQNNINYGTYNIKFTTNKIHDYEFDDKYDLIICKDVLQHWSNVNVISFINSIKNYKYCLLINDLKNNKYKTPIGFKTFNADINDGGYTPIDLSIEPYNVKGEYIFEWQSCDTLKKCYLIKNYQV
jgi:SAM-dependent methyltransferase